MHGAASSLLNYGFNSRDCEQAAWVLRAGSGLGTRARAAIAWHLPAPCQRRMQARDLSSPTLRGTNREEAERQKLNN